MGSFCYKYYENQKSITERKRSMRRIALAALVFGFLLHWQPVEAGQFTILYSNDTGGLIDPCPT